MIIREYDDKGNPLEISEALKVKYGKERRRKLKLMKKGMIGLLTVFYILDKIPCYNYPKVFNWVPRDKQAIVRYLDNQKELDRLKDEKSELFKEMLYGEGPGNLILKEDMKRLEKNISICEEEIVELKGREDVKGYLSSESKFKDHMNKGFWTAIVSFFLIPDLFVYLSRRKERKILENLVKVED